MRRGAHGPARTVVREAVAERPAGDAVPRIHVDVARSSAARGLFVQLLVGDDDHDVARVDEMRRRAVDADFATAGAALDSVCLQASAVGGVPAIDDVLASLAIKQHNAVRCYSRAAPAFSDFRLP